MIKYVSGEHRAPIVQLEDISRSYQMGVLEVQALKNVFLNIGRGEFLVILA